MDLRERDNNDYEAMRAAMDGRQTRMWTALPGIIQSFDAQAMTCVVLPSVQSRVTTRGQNGTNPVTNFQTLPKLLDCPVVFPSGGGCALTFPLQQGDECLVVFASRGIDFWWQQGGAQPPAEARMHDLSDGFVIPGPFSQPRVLENVSTVGAELRSTDGSVSILLDPSGAITLKAPNGVTLDGNLTVTGDVVASNISLVNHLHGEVQTGSDTTGPPQ